MEWFFVKVVFIEYKTFYMVIVAYENISLMNIYPKILSNAVGQIFKYNKLT